MSHSVELFCFFSAEDANLEVVPKNIDGMVFFLWLSSDSSSHERYTCFPINFFPSQAGSGLTAPSNRVMQDTEEKGI